MRVIAKVLIGVGAAVIIGPVALFVYTDLTWRWEADRFAHRSPIAVGLSRDNFQAKEEFQRRIRDRFPIGTAENDPVDALKSQGFEAGYPPPPDKTGAEFHAMHLTFAQICRSDWSVWWQVDPNDRLSAIDASYFVVCS